MASRDSLQFVRFSGYKQGPAGKRHTVGSILAEGLRKPSHISHLPGAPRFSVTPLGDQVEDPQGLPGWIAEEMATSRNQVTIRGKLQERKVRSDALAIGTIIASLPETMADYDEERFSSFCGDTTEWARDFLSARDYMLHFRLEHLDELHPHMHLWFTPKASGQREGNWSFNNLFGDTSKAFYHNLLENFYADVGHKYFERRARPSAERKKRMPRHFAIQQRDVGDRDVVRQMREGLVTDSSSKTPDVVDSPMSRESLDKALSRLSGDEISTIPVISDRLNALRADHAHHIEESQSYQQSLESQLARLRSDHDELKASHAQLRKNNGDLNKRIADDVSGASELRINKSAFFAGASTFMSSGLWDNIVKEVLVAAYSNANRAYHVSQSDWEGLVIDDALPNIVPEHGSAYIEDVEYWLSQAVKGIYASEFSAGSGSSLEAFSDAEPLSRSADSAGTTPEKTGSRFRKAAAESESTPGDLWPSR